MLIGTLAIAAILALFGRRIFAVLFALVGIVVVGVTLESFEPRGRDKPVEIDGSTMALHVSLDETGDTLRYTVTNPSDHFIDKVLMTCRSPDNGKESWPLAKLAPHDTFSGTKWVGSGWQNLTCEITQAKGYSTLPGWTYESGKAPVLVDKANS